MSMTLQDAMLNAALNRASHRLTQPNLQARLATAERAARHAGVCMSCLHGGPEPYGCSDCQNTGRSSEFLSELDEAQDRIFDLLLGDDAQAYKEAERYLAKTRPDLKARLDARD